MKEVNWREVSDLTLLLGAIILTLTGHIGGALLCAFVWVFR